MNLHNNAWIELNAAALNHNIAQYKAVIGDRLLAPVIKSNAYGHGLLPIAQLCNQNPQVGWLCVASLSDALKLRDHGIQKPIMVMSCVDADLSLAIGKNIEFIITHEELAHDLNEMGKRYNAVFNVHLKIDTGLSRLGVPIARAIPFVHQLLSLPYLQLHGLCTHYAETQKEDQSYANYQLEQFYAILDQLEAQGITIPFIHASNSAATTTLNLARCNLFRIGIGIYGIWPSAANKAMTLANYPAFTLQPVMTWKTRVMALKTLPANQPVGYDRTTYTTRETKIAIVPIGYYDGYDFRLFNKSGMIIQDCLAPTIGRISMNVATLDVTNIPHIKRGDEVTILGNHPDITVYALSTLAGNPNVRELMIKINATIPRIIVPHQEKVLVAADQLQSTPSPK